MAADLFRVVWTPMGSTDIPSKPMKRERAMARFDAGARAASIARGRLWVLREADWQRRHSV